jgi:hypothetical protein
MQKYANESCHKLNSLDRETSPHHFVMLKTLDLHINFLPCNKWLNSYAKLLHVTFKSVDINVVFNFVQVEVFAWLVLRHKKLV